MRVTLYHKLVRDRIPEIIRQSGKACNFRTLSEAEYLTLLDEKLREELNEYLSDHDPEELADLLEVIRAAAKARGTSITAVETLRAKKAKSHGGFDKRVLLTEVRQEERKIEE